MKKGIRGRMDIDDDDDDCVNNVDAGSYNSDDEIEESQGHLDLGRLKRDLVLLDARNKQKPIEAFGIGSTNGASFGRAVFGEQFNDSGSKEKKVMAYQRDIEERHNVHLESQGAPSFSDNVDDDDNTNATIVRSTLLMEDNDDDSDAIQSLPDDPTDKVLTTNSDIPTIPSEPKRRVGKKKPRILHLHKVLRPNLSRANRSNAIGIALTRHDIGKHVMVAGYGRGVLKFFGITEFDDGKDVWLGVALKDKVGKHNGTVEGKQYFQCTDGHGMFAQLKANIVCLLPEEHDEEKDSPKKPERRAAWNAPVNPDQNDAPTALPPTPSPFSVRQVHVRANMHAISDDEEEIKGNYILENDSDNEDLPNGEAINRKTSVAEEVAAHQELIRVASIPMSQEGEKQVLYGHTTGLHRAACTGNVHMLVELLNLGTDEIDAPDEFGRSPLMHAVHFDNFDCTNTLLSRGANVNYQEPEAKSSPLHDAAFSGNPVMMLLLLEHGADAGIEDVDGRLPLHWAADNPNSEVVTLMLQKVPQLNINAQDGQGMTPIMWSCFNNRAQTTKILLKKGAALDEKDIDGKTAMHWAVHEETDCLKLVLSKDSTYFRDLLGRTVAHIASEHNNTKAMRYILKLRPDACDDVDKQGRTPIHWAAASANSEVLNVLVKAGGNVLTKDMNNATARDYVQAKLLTWELGSDLLEALRRCSEILFYTRPDTSTLSVIDDHSSDNVSIASSVASRMVLERNYSQLRDKLQQQQHIENLQKIPRSVSAVRGNRQRLEEAMKEEKERLMKVNALENNTSLPATKESDDINGGEKAVRGIKPPSNSPIVPHLLKQHAPRPNPTNSLPISDMVISGTYMLKLSKGGSGAARKKLFWTDGRGPALFWANSTRDKNSKRVETTVTNVEFGPDKVIEDRPDFETNPDQYQYCLRVKTTAKPIYLLAEDEQTYSTWVNALTKMCNIRRKSPVKYKLKEDHGSSSSNIEGDDSNLDDNQTSLVSVRSLKLSPMPENEKISSQAWSSNSPLVNSPFTPSALKSPVSATLNRKPRLVPLQHHPTSSSTGKPIRLIPRLPVMKNPMSSLVTNISKDGEDS
eukprot:m.27578 g.27578  ORF g.27578 m.27578 type:complete len:1085 (+) comp5957_c0_seq1:54-3308(+)